MFSVKNPFTAPGLAVDGDVGRMWTERALGVTLLQVMVQAARAAQVAQRVVAR
jgi:hypothetical protein